MTDENGTNMNGETDNCSQVPLSMNINTPLFILFYSVVLEMILETSNHSTIERNVHNILRKSFLEQRSITWKPIKVELVVNTQLTDDFFGNYILYKKSIFFFSRCVTVKNNTEKKSIFLLIHLYTKSKLVG
jgi:hypothetical protein